MKRKKRWVLQACLVIDLYEILDNNEFLMGSCSSTTIYLDGRNEKYEKNNVCVCVCWRDVLATMSSDRSSTYVHTYIY